MDPAKFLAQPKMALLAHVIRALSDLAAPKKVFAMLQDAPRLAFYEQATGAVLKHLPGAHRCA